MTQSPPGGSQGPRRRFRIIPLIIILLLIVIILLFFFPRPTATITLTPASRVLSTSLNYATDNQSFPENQTGTGTPTGPPNAGKNATGTLTFLNYTFNWVTIPQGTSISTTSGQQVVTDEPAYLPPDPPSIPGTASVPAHAANAGTNGNIPAMSLNDTPCCTSISTGITATNAAAFSGGTDNQTTNTVQQSDIDKVVNNLIPKLTQQAQTDIQKHLNPNEQAVTPAQCSLTNATPSAGVGASVSSFTVAVSLSCSFAEYDPVIACSQATNQLKPTAPLGFILASPITCTKPQVTAGYVAISAKGTWKYHFTAIQKSDMAKHIEGETQDTAQTWLSQQTGVTHVSISLTGPILLTLFGLNNTIPDDLNAITING